MNKLLIGIVVIIVVIGGVLLFISSQGINEENTTTTTPSSDVDQLSESGRVTNTNENILAEIDEAINYLD